MKVSVSTKNIYDSLYDQYNKLKEKVDTIIEQEIEKKWHYESRVKTLESYALKLETGRYPDPKKIDDFFACTIAVENIDSIKTAEELVRSKFIFSERRPPDEELTFKRSDSFPFDDLRLYVLWEDDPSTRPTELNNTLFEVQIKTFLQHAWSIATHDLVYKSDDKDWSKERIAYQIKAMLEHAEVSISEAKAWSQSPFLIKSDKKTNRIRGHWFSLMKGFYNYKIMNYAT